MTEKTLPDREQENARHELELRIQRQIAFASGLFQGDVTIRTLLESLAEGVVIIDSSGTILLVNTHAEQMFGYPKNELIGKPHAMLIPERFRKVHEEHEAGFFKEPRVRPMGQLLDLAGLRRDGSEFPVEISLGFIETVNGVLALAFVSNITVRKQAEKALQESEQRFVSFMLHLPAAAWMKDLHGRYVYANAEAERVFSTPLSALLDKTDGEVFPPETARQFRENDERVLEEGGSLQTTEALRQTDGIEHHSIVSKFAVPSPNGQPAYVAGVAFDITERKRLEEELRDAEIRYRTLFESIDEGFCIIEMIFDENDKPIDYRFLEINPSFEKQTGLANAQGKRMRELAPKHEEHWFEIYGRIALTGEPARFQNRAEQLHRWYDVYAFRFGRPEDRQVAILFNDITERKRVGEALRESEKKFSKIFDTAPVGITISSLDDGRFVEINREGERLSGYRRDEVIGRTALEFNIWKDPAERARMIEEVRKEGAVRDREMTFRDKEGNILLGLFSAVVIDIGGKKHLLSIVRDITERKRTEEEIERLNTDLAARAGELEGANRELEAFNYTVAHDLRKPLTVINGYCQAIKELCGDKLDEACTDYLREVYDGTLRMNRLIEALLNFSRLAHIEPRWETVDLSGIAQEVAAGLKQAEPARRVEFRISEGISVDGDANLLRVVLENLLNNAWKYTGMREEAVIEFGVTEIDGHPAWFVRDNGPGFDMADAEKLFLPFQRLPGAEEFKGFGIGLATVARIIQRHGGRVWAEGEPGNGATFYFVLSNKTW